LSELFREVASLQAIRKLKEEIMEEIVIPDIYCPFQSLISPYLEQVREHALDWAKRFRLIQGEAGMHYYRAIDLSEFICRIYPKASLEELLVLGDYYIWGFIYDDLYDDERFSTRPEAMDALYKHLLVILQTPSLVTPQGSFAEATADLFQRMRLLIPSSYLQKRFVQDNSDWLVAEREDAIRHADQHVVDVQTCLDSRIKSTAALAAIDIIEIVEHIEIPAEIYESQPFQSILATTAHILASTNDIYSLQKELSLDDVNNVVVVVQRDRACSLQEAMNQACALIEMKIRSFQEQAQHFPTYHKAQIDQGIQTFLTDLGLMISGNLDWHRASTRYKFVGSRDKSKA
jgi:Terpene synthase family 2, C-terminal metal binding